MEIWKKIEKFNNEYEISNRGRIRSVDAILIRSNGRPHRRRPKILKPDTKHNGYAKGAVCVNKKMKPYQIHRLVAEAFIENPKNKETVNHINGIKDDNRVENLEWATRKEQAIHARDMGLTTIMRGSDIGNSILKEHQVIEIREKFKPRIYTRKMLAEEYGVKECTIKDILQRRSWKHLP